MNNVFPLGLSYDDVLLIPQYSDIDSREEVDLTINISKRCTLKIPLVSSPMNDVTNDEFAIDIGLNGGLGLISRFNTVETQCDMVNNVKKKNQICCAAVGIKNGSLERAESLVKAGADILLIDVANGHLKKVIDFTKILKSKFSDRVDIWSGLVATSDGAKKLFEAGADCVNAGIGGGSICTTRIQTGCGVPNITTILDCATIARKFGRSLIVDAGIKSPGDVVKALAAGASAVRCGYFLSGFETSPGELIEKNGKKFKSYSGSTSVKEKEKHLDVIKKEVDKNYTNHIEGVSGMVPYRGELSEYLQGVIGNIKSGFSYCGARNIDELWKKAKFIQITEAGRRESGAHDVILESK